jgi:rubrerythrin
MILAEVFDKAERLETVAAEIYAALAERFAEDARAAELFRKLAAEEVQHAARVRMLASQYRRKGSAFRAGPPPLAAIDDLLREGGEWLSRLRSKSFRLTLEETWAKLADLEERFAAAHAEQMSSVADPALRAFFEKLAAQDRAHVALFRRSVTRPPTRARG